MFLKKCIYSIIIIEYWKDKYFLKMPVKDFSGNDNLVSMVYFMINDVLKAISRIKISLTIMFYCQRIL